MDSLSLEALLKPLEVWASSLSLQDWIMLFGYVIGVQLSLFVLYSLIIVLLRWFGLYHPKYYRLFPRLPWRMPVRLWLPIKAWHERTFKMGKQSSGGFSSWLGVLSQLYQPGKLLLGRAYALGFPLLQPVGIHITRHIKIFAMTGAGKTTALISILATWIGSAMVIDPKGQITRALARLDKSREWYTFDPYGITGLPCIQFNVFDVIKDAWEKMGDTGAVLWAERVSECLITVPEGARSPYFYDTSKAFISGLILHMLTVHPEDDHSLPIMRTVITQGYRVFNDETGEEETKGNEAFVVLLNSMMRNPAFDGAIMGAAAAVKNASGETMGNITSTLQQQTKWLDLPVVRRYLQSSDFKLSDLKTRDDIVLSLVSPVLSVRGELKDCFRLFINMAAYTFELEPTKKGQCLMVVDEFPSLGYNPIFEILLPVARSQGFTFLIVSQDIEILAKPYSKTWETFIGNADVVLCMGTNHQGTLDYISGILGYKTITIKDKHSGHKHQQKVPVAESDQLRRLLDPDSGRMLALRPGKRAMVLMNDPYFKALPVTDYDADPDHKESCARRLSRQCFSSSPGSADKNEDRPLSESPTIQQQDITDEHEDN